MRLGQRLRLEVVLPGRDVRVQLLGQSHLHGLRALAAHLWQIQILILEDLLIVQLLLALLLPLNGFLLVLIILLLDCRGFSNPPVALDS